jgi:hypothetical protein
LQSRFNFFYLVGAAKALLYPTNDNARGEVGVGDDVIWVGLFQADGAVCASGVGAVVGIYGVVGGVKIMPSAVWRSSWAMFQVVVVVMGVTR